MCSVYFAANNYGLIFYFVGYHASGLSIPGFLFKLIRNSRLISFTTYVGVGSARPRELVCVQWPIC